jgi:hypothetical protein
MSGNYPDGVHEGTRGAPWNDHETVTCGGCRRFYYPDTQPDGVPRDDETKPPVTEYGIENELCETCETEIDICDECGEARLTMDGKTARALHGCASCQPVALPCLDCGADVTVCECEPNAAQCGACGARQFVLLGTLRETSHIRCRNCGADSYTTTDETRDAVRRAADISERIDKGGK